MTSEGIRTGHRQPADEELIRTLGSVPVRGCFFFGRAAPGRYLGVCGREPTGAAGSQWRAPSKLGHSAGLRAPRRPQRSHDPDEDAAVAASLQQRRLDDEVIEVCQAAPKRGLSTRALGSQEQRRGSLR